MANNEFNATAAANAAAAAASATVAANNVNTILAPIKTEFTNIKTMLDVPGGPAVDQLTAIKDRLEQLVSTVQAAEGKYTVEMQRLSDNATSKGVALTPNIQITNANNTLVKKSIKMTALTQAIKAAEARLAEVRGEIDTLIKMLSEKIGNSS